jgi:Protein of unknown function (DUF3562)
MSDQPDSSPANVEMEIATLAREADMPLEFVHRVYTDERAKLEKTARIKTYVPVLVHQHVKAVLRQHRDAAA